MKWEEHASGKVMVLRVLESRLDAQSERGLKRAVADVVSREHRHLVIDLALVQFMDSIGLNALISAIKHVGPRGELALTGVGPQIRTLLRLARLDKVFQIFESVERAVEAVCPA